MRYLDHAATTPMHPAVREAILPLLRADADMPSIGNPSSHHTVGERAASILAEARARVAAVFGMRSGDIVFTSGGTEANNLAIKGITLASRRNTVITTPIEHESVLESVDYLARLHDTTVDVLPVDATARVNVADLVSRLSPDVALISIGYANNEVGTVQDVAGLAEAAREARVPLHLDAVQAAGWLPLAGTGADALSVAGHKIGAGQGTGVLAIRGRIPLEPLMHGGGQERGRRSGTESVIGAVAIATALEIAERERADSADAAVRVRDAFIARVLSTVPAARLTGHAVHRLPGSASFTFAGTSGEAVLLELERRGVVSSSGSACAAGSSEPSHVLTAMGIDDDIAQTAVRFTLPHGAQRDLDDVADALVDAVAAVRG